MKINTIGYHHTHDADFIIERPNGSGDYLLLIIKTPALFRFAGKEEIVPAASVILYSKDTPQYYRALGSAFGNDWIHFQLTEEDLLFLRTLQIPFDKVISLSSIQDLSYFIKKISYEKYSNNLYQKETMTLYMNLLFYKLSELIYSTKKEEPDYHYEKMALLRSKIYTMPYENWSIEGLSHELSMSKSRFQHIYKNIFGISVMNDVILSRIEHAKYLLSTTNLPIHQVAAMCGYPCSVHFMRQFKSRENVTPSEYRKRFLAASHSSNLLYPRNQ